jgi:hypothetical protein
LIFSKNILSKKITTYRKGSLRIKLRIGIRFRLKEGRYRCRVKGKSGEKGSKRGRRGRRDRRGRRKVNSKYRGRGGRSSRHRGRHRIGSKGRHRESSSRSSRSRQNNLEVIYINICIK